MGRFTLSRRHLLRGLGGAAIGLPVLEVMLNSSGMAYAQTGTPLPKRYFVCFDGQSLGCDDDPMDNDYVPDTVGPNYDLKSALAPLATFNNVQNEISVISGLKIPTANGGPVPSGGRSDDFHVNSLSPLLCGVRSGSSTQCYGPSSDQIVANAIAGNTTFPSLAFRVQASWYLSVSAPYGRDIMSYGIDPSGNPLPIPPTVSPQAAFQSLFGNFMPPVDPTAAAKANFDMRTRLSVLDLVKGSIQRLTPKLGNADQQRLQQHFDYVRDLEKQIAAIPPPTSSTCQLPPNPGPDPAVGGAQGVDSSGNNTYSTNLGYSNEDARARAFCDLIAMAFTCDLTRVATLMITMFQSHMNMYAITGQTGDVHELGHCAMGCSGGTLQVSKAIAWHVKHFGYLIAKLRDTPEGAGSVLDNTAAVFVNEGGHGLDPSTGKVYSSHCTDNMACLIAGRAGGLQAGQHIVATGMHPANVLISAMTAVGVPGSLGEVSGPIPGLIG